VSGNTVRGKDCTDFWLEGANRSAAREKQLFWLSSTPIPNCTLSPPRAQADVPKYNAAARAVLMEEPFASSVKIVDLYAFVLGYISMANFIKDAITRLV